MDLITYRDTQGRGAITALALKAGVSRCYLQHVLSGFRGVSWDMAERLAKASDGVLKPEDILRVNAAARQSYRNRKVTAA